MTSLRLVSHHLCPYVQRAAIALAEKAVPFERRHVDLAAKPAWFTAISPLGKVPLLQVGDAVLFESAVILEYLDETQPPSMHPADPLARATHRGWIELASATLNDIARFYTAPDEAALRAQAGQLSQRFAWLDRHLGDGPYFDGAGFRLVDCAWAPVFRYLDAFERVDDFGLLDGLRKVSAYRAALAKRSSVCQAVAADYPARLWQFLGRRGSALSRRIGVAA
jgi:glutathione S-transferase